MFKPTKKLVAIEPLDVDAVTPGGIHIPSAEDARIRRGKVVAVGEKCEEFEVGQTVIFDIGKSINVKLGAVDVELAHRDNILGIE